MDNGGGRKEWGGGAFIGLVIGLSEISRDWLA